MHRVTTILVEMVAWSFVRLMATWCRSESHESCPIKNHLGEMRASALAAFWSLPVLAAAITSSYHRQSRSVAGSRAPLRSRTTPPARLVVAAAPTYGRTPQARMGIH